MLSFIAENLATIIIGAIVALWLILAIVKIVRDRKKGGHCAGCPYSGSCHRSSEHCKINKE